MTIALAATLATSPFIPSLSVFANEIASHSMTGQTEVDSETGIITFADKRLETAVISSLVMWNGFDEDTTIVTVEDMESLYSLSIYESGVNLDGIQYASNLYDLGLVGSHDLTPIKSLNIQELYLNGVYDLSTIETLQITSLTIGGVYNSGLLANFGNLNRLVVQENTVTNVEFLNGLPQLEQLVLNGNKISDFSPISNLTNLTQLYIDATGAENLDFISNLTNLKHLNLSENSIVDLTPIAHIIPNLEQFQGVLQTTTITSQDVIGIHKINNMLKSPNKITYELSHGGKVINDEFVWGSLSEGTHELTVKFSDGLNFHGTITQKINSTLPTIGNNKIDFTSGEILAPNGESIAKMPTLSIEQQESLLDGGEVELTEGTLQSTDEGLIVRNAQYHFLLNDTTLTISKVLARSTEAEVIAFVDVLTGVLTDTDGEELGTLTDIVVNENGRLVANYTAIEIEEPVVPPTDEPTVDEEDDVTPPATEEENDGDDTTPPTGSTEDDTNEESVDKLPETGMQNAQLLTMIGAGMASLSALPFLKRKNK